MDFGARGPLSHHFHNEIHLTASMMPQLTVHTNEEWTLPSCEIPQQSRSETPTCDGRGAFPLQSCIGGWCYLLFDSAKLGGIWDNVTFQGFVKWRLEGSFHGTRPWKENSSPWGISIGKTPTDLRRGCWGKMACKGFGGLGCFVTLVQVTWDKLFVCCH